MSDQDRRRPARHSLQLAVKVRRGDEELSGDIVSASARGCLLQVPIPLEKGEVLDVRIPELLIPAARLRVVRCQRTPSGYLVSTCFDELATESEDSIRETSDEQKPPSQKPPSKPPTES